MEVSPETRFKFALSEIEMFPDQQKNTYIEFDLELYNKLLLDNKLSNFDKEKLKFSHLQNHKEFSELNKELKNIGNLSTLSEYVNERTSYNHLSIKQQNAIVEYYNIDIYIPFTNKLLQIFQFLEKNNDQKFPQGEDCDIWLKIADFHDKLLKMHLTYRKRADFENLEANSKKQIQERSLKIGL